MKENDYVSTNIQLPREQLKLLKHKAVEEGKSMGQVVRELLSRGLSGKGTVTPQGGTLKIPEKSPFAAIIGLGRSGVTDESHEHDKYLYGKPKSEWKN